MNASFTWHQLWHLWLFLLAGGFGWDMGKGISRWIRALIRRRAHRRSAAIRKALHEVIGMVDKMDRRPSAGGGVLPVEKADILHRARKAAGL